MKKCLMAAIGLMMAMSVNAQYLNDSKTPFTQGKTYVGASLSSTDLSYNGLSKGHLGINGKVGYFFADNLLGTAQVAYEKYKDVPYSISSRTVCIWAHRHFSSTMMNLMISFRVYRWVTLSSSTVQ